MSQTVLVLCTYFFTRLLNATEVDAIKLLITTRPSSCYLTPSIIICKNFTIDYRGAHYKT